ncbi:GxxExxY protein [Geomobilimonas luticola]|uniref:GxxExxY protein n=1 Tax=Geomobilimonas luticola TaxID=1114878 RepID=A0ABS5SCK1_9BACT|nr:GxxExxY protein [Geomobilimonas luticola]MBT0653096.1 GxxExxY protein [Geomobilimonas luticola]
MDLNKISSEIINAAITVHKELGPGLLESVYQSCLIVEFAKRKLKTESEVPVPVIYQGIKVNDEGFRLDLLVEGSVVVELKSVDKVMPVHKKQLLTYLRLANKPLGLLVNFNETTLVNGITRIANGSKNL